MKYADAKNLAEKIILNLNARNLIARYNTEKAVNITADLLMQYVKTPKNHEAELLEACKYVIRYHREHDSGGGELFGLDFVTTCINAVRNAGGIQAVEAATQKA